MKQIITGIIATSIFWSMFAPFAPVANAQARGRTLNMNRTTDNTQDGLKFTLSEGSEEAETRTVQTPAVADPLSDNETGGLLGRLPAIKSDPDDQSDFAKRAGTLPAPKTGEKIPVKFPAAEQTAPPQGQSGDTLSVLRFSPEGEIPLAPDLSVTFSHPMVAVTSQEEAAKNAPVELSPQVEGRWRWLGTRTLMFDTDKRFPMATKFTARVPAETRSATGQVLDKDVTWTFTTPPPKMTQFYPGSGQTTRRDVIMFAAFDQAVNPGAVLGMMSVTAGGKKLPVRLATQAEIDANPTLSYYISQSQPGRWLAFRALNSDGLTENALPGATAIQVTMPKGTPSAEGPLTTTAAQSFGFQTYGAMQFVRAQCGWDYSSKNCSPFSQWQLQFTNGIDASKFTKEMIKIEPAVEGANIYPSGSFIYIDGVKKGRTTYKITVDGSLGDVFGQTLGNAATATIKTGNAEPNFYSQGGTMVVLDPSAKQFYSIYTTNHTAAKVRIYKVKPEDWNAFTQYYRRINYDDGQRPTIPGRLIFDKTVAIKNIADELVETRIDLAAGLDAGLGNVIIDIEPTVKRDKYDRMRLFKWIQSTQIGIDAFVDNTELVGFATELRTGKPLSGVELSIWPNSASANPSTAVAEQPVEKGWLDSVWEWFGGSGGPSADSVETLNADGTPADIETIEPAQSNTTGANGILRLELPAYSQGGGMNMLIARRGKDVAFIPENSDYYWQDTGNWYKRPDVDSLRWFVFDDRKMYKPGEEVAVKGYVRMQTAGKLGDIEAAGAAARTITWTARDPRNNEIAKGTFDINAFGAFDLKFKLPDNINLGYASVNLSSSPSMSGNSYNHQFQIQEFRRPEFEVSAKVDSEGPHFVGGKADLSVEAKYFAGGGLANAETNWTVTATPTNYTPPNRDDYTFGTWVPWWRIYDYGRPGLGGITQNFKGVTDASGVHRLKIDFESVKPPRPYTISASGSVQDVNRQTWAGRTTLMVHPSELYVGIKTPRTFVQKGEKINIESIVSDLDGKLIGGRDIEIKAVLKDWRFEGGSWKEVNLDEQTCNIKSADSGVKCEFVAKQGGRYTVTATVMDDRERFNESELTIWVPGGKTPPNRSVEREEAQIIPSKKDYAPGEIAELLVIAPFTPAEGVLTLRRDGLVKTERFTMKDSSITLKIPIDEKYLPNIYAQIDLVGSAPRTDDKGEPNDKLPPRPAYASGNLNLSVSTASRKLTVSAEPQEKTLAPGGETKVAVEVKDHRGEPVANSEVAIVVVDESVLSLTGYSISDPASVFYTQRGPGVQNFYSRKDVLLGNPLDVDGEGSGDGSPQPTPPPPPVMAEMSDRLPSAARFSSVLKVNPATRAEGLTGGFAVDGASANEEQQNEPIELRENFDALALWSPSVKTDSNGKAMVDVKLPDNLTRYRITVVTVDTAKRFGKSESNITARKPLMVRPSAPRFMNFGDKIELPVVVQNQTDQDMTVDVAVRATNAILTDTGSSAVGFQTQGAKHIVVPGQPSASAGKRMLIKANSREEIRFPVATIKAGTARFQFAVSSGGHSDAAEISLPVWTPATTEAFATYGTTDQNGAIFQPVQTPGDVYPQFGGIEVTTSSTQLQELTDAFIYLSNYPYECSEQISSRMISTAALRDVLNAFKAKDMPTAAQLEAKYARDIQILQSRQRSDGSFGLWKRDRERYEYPFLTVHVAHALALAKTKGYKVPDDMLNKTKPYLKDVEKHFTGEWYVSSPEVRWTISAYALYIRDMMGDKDAGKAKKLLAEATIEKMPFEALGWVLSVLADDKGSAAEVDAIVRFLMNRTTETASTANFVTNYRDGGWLIMASNRRADGVLLEALIKVGRSGDTLVPTDAKAAGKGSTASRTVAGRTGDEDKSVLAPVNDLIPKLVRGLLAHRKKGHWGSTQENVFILLAMDKYFNAFEKVTPDFVTKVWLGNTYAGEQVFKGRSVDSNVLNIPMSYLTEQGGGNADDPVSNPVNLILDKQGPGRLYYRIGMQYAPKNLKLDPTDYGFTVLRKYEAVDDPADVKQNADGSWTIKSGARVRVRLTMVAQARRYHVALVDYLPAGLEILNPGLAVTEAIPADTGGGNTGVVEFSSRSFGGGWWWRQNWFEHQNFRDERAEAFASLLWEGVYNYTYVARATTPGQFIAPPAKAEEMYAPETFGRTGTDFVNVE